MDEVAVTQNVKINTIEDHVLELFIKDIFQNTKPLLMAHKQVNL